MKFKLVSVLLAALGFALAPVCAEEGLEPPVPVRTVAPKYPDQMRRDRSSGIVQVSVLIDESGNVLEPKVEKSTADAFIEPAIEALKKWKFKPAKRGGEAIALRVSVPILFKYAD